MLSDAAVKLQEGKARLAGAGDDERLLGMALMSLHGALEEHFREQLAREIKLETESRPGWMDLVDLWQKHRVLSPADRSLILRTNSKRNQIAHGDPFDLSRTEVERYAQFVQDFMGVRARPSRRWSKVEDAVVWDDSGVKVEESSGWSSFWSLLFPSSRASSGSLSHSTDLPEQPTPVAQLHSIGRRLRVQSGWMAKMALVAAVALLSFWFWNSWWVSLGITAVILLLVHRGKWLRAGYVYVAGLVYGYVTAVLGLATAVAFVAALLWPLSAGFYYFTDGTLELPEGELLVPTIEAADEVIEEGRGDDGVTAVATQTPVPANEPIQIEVIGNSNVRAEPNIEAAPIGIAAGGEVYEVLDVNVERTWYKIELASGQQGWIGSSRVVEVAP